MQSVEPVFSLVTGSGLPADVSIPQICKAVENVNGHGAVAGAQLFGAIWRIYPSNTKTQVKVISEGFAIRGVKINVTGRNPFLMKIGDGHEIQTTRSTVNGVTISYFNDEMVDCLKNLGLKLLGPLMMDRARDSDGRLTRWLMCPR